MTERFKLGYVCGDFGLVDNGVWIDLHSMSENSEKNVQICINKLNALAEENEQLKKELSEYNDFVFSDDKILCYTCLFCTHKGIYEVDCDMKGHVDVHGVCFSYTKKELQE